MNHNSYSAEYKSELMELIENGQNVGDVAQEYKVPVKTIRRWMDEGQRERKNAFPRKRRNSEYQEQYEYSTNRRGSI